MLVIFVFGLLHGMGFASAFKEIGTDTEHFMASLLFFNLGVEIAQISILLLAYFMIGKWFSNKDWYTKRIVYPVSSLIGCIALYWTIQRIFIQ